MRVRFDLPFNAPMIYEVDGERFDYRTTSPYAEIANVPAGIVEEVRKTLDGRFIRVTVAGDEGDLNNPYGYHHGWYTTRILSAEDAANTRQSWAVLRPQPDVD